jgi:hypothetical protein
MLARTSVSSSIKQWFSHKLKNHLLAMQFRRSTDSNIWTTRSLPNSTSVVINISQGFESAGMLESKVSIIDHLHPVSRPVIETIRRVDNCRS